MPTTKITRHITRRNWLEATDRTRGRRPMLRAEFVAELGRDVWLVDVREREELVGKLGYLPGSCAVPLAEIHKIPEQVGLTAPMVLVCDDGERSSAAALYLEKLGMTTVAALLGGVKQWRELGFAVARGQAILDRRFEDTPVSAVPPGGPIEAGMHLSAEQVEWHVGQPGAVRWVKFAALMLHGKTACIDGRDERSVIGTPGGDAGEFTLALAAVEQLSEVPLDDAKIAKLLEVWVDAFGRFYMHSDTEALDHLIASLREDPRIAPHLGGLVEVGDWRAFLRMPPAELREPLLEHLAESEHVGCGHLRLSMQHPEDYGGRTDAVAGFMRAFFHERWAGVEEAQFVILEGDHAEGAIVQVVLDGPLFPHTKIPMISPTFEGLQIFVLHPEITDRLRRYRAGLLVAELPELGLDADRLGDRIRELGKRQLAATAERLAPGLPVYEVRFDREGHFRVRQVG